MRSHGYLSLYFCVLIIARVAMEDTCKFLAIYSFQMLAKLT